MRQRGKRVSEAWHEVERRIDALDFPTREEGDADDIPAAGDDRDSPWRQMFWRTMTEQPKDMMAEQTDTVSDADHIHFDATSCYLAGTVDVPWPLMS